MTLLINNKYTIVCCHIKSKHRMSILFLLLLSNQNSYKKASWHLTTVILYEPQVRELGPHVTLDAMETASKWSYLSWQLGGESCLLVAQRGRRVAAVHGDWRSLHWGNRKCKPKTEQFKKNSQKSLLKKICKKTRWSGDPFSTCLWCQLAAPACLQCFGWPPSQRDSRTSNHICFATAQTDSCFGPSDPTPLQTSGQRGWDEDQGEKSESLEPPGHTWALHQSGARWLERWSPVCCRAAVWGHLQAMTVK